MIEFAILIVALVLSVFGFKKMKKIQTDKGTSKVLTLLASVSAAFIVFMVTMVIGFVAFVDTPKPVSKENTLKILSVSDYNFTIDDKQAVGIYIGRNDKEYFSITVPRSMIKQGNKIIKNKDNYIKYADITASFNGKQYFFIVNDSASSILDFYIQKIDYKNKNAIIKVYTKIYNPDDNSYTEIKKQNFVISGILFENLTKNISK